jgi:hypothetical protein
MLGKRTLLAMALSIVALFALPAVASATWKHHSTPIQQNQQLTFTGNARFDTGGGGAECQLKIVATFLAAQTTGTLENLQPDPTSDTANCKGIGGYAFCQVHQFTPTGLPWTFHTTLAETTQIQIDGPNPGEVTVKGNGVSHQAFVITTGNITAAPTGAFCPGKHILITPGTLLAIPNQENTFSSVQLNGTLLPHKQTTSGAVDTEQLKITGQVEIENPELRNTYSI